MKINKTRAISQGITFENCVPPPTSCVGGGGSVQSKTTTARLPLWERNKTSHLLDYGRAPRREARGGGIPLNNGLPIASLAGAGESRGRVTCGGLIGRPAAPRTMRRTPGTFRRIRPHIYGLAPTLSDPGRGGPFSCLHPQPHLGRERATKIGEYKTNISFPFISGSSNGSGICFPRVYVKDVRAEESRS